MKLNFTKSDKSRVFEKRKFMSMFPNREMTSSTSNDELKQTHANKVIEAPLVIKETNIPRHVFQTFEIKTLPKEIQEIREILIKNNPTFKYFLFDDNDCRAFISKHFEPIVLWAFNMLVPGAYKADLWRYCVLYKLGGIYLDIKFISTPNALTKLLNGNNFVEDMKSVTFVRAEGHDIITYGEDGIYNGLISSYPNNEILMRCINQIVENVKKDTYCKVGPNGFNGFLNISGPGLLRKMMTDTEYKKYVTLDFQHPRGGHQQINFKDDKSIGFAEHPSYRLSLKQYYMKKHGADKHYATLWSALKVYNYHSIQWQSSIEITKTYFNNVSSDEQAICIIDRKPYNIVGSIKHLRKSCFLVELYDDNSIWMKMWPNTVNEAGKLKRHKLIFCNEEGIAKKISESFFIDGYDNNWDLEVLDFNMIGNEIEIIYKKQGRIIRAKTSSKIIFNTLKLFDVENDEKEELNAERINSDYWISRAGNIMYA